GGRRKIFQEFSGESGSARTRHWNCARLDFWFAGRQHWRRRRCWQLQWRQYRSAFRLQYSARKHHVFDTIELAFGSNVFPFAGRRYSIKPFHLIEMKWTRASPPEYHRLPTGFVDNTIAFQAARNANRFTFGVISSDQSRIW